MRLMFEVYGREGSFRYKSRYFDDGTFETTSGKSIVSQQTMVFQYKIVDGEIYSMGRKAGSWYDNSPVRHTQVVQDLYHQYLAKLVTE